jgi:threonine/homoserine/homoserine lactone efflux protein
VPSLSVVPVFAATALALLVIPGPAVLYITTRSAAQGRRAGLVSLLGVHTGSLVHAVAAVVGLSAVLVASAAAFSVVKLGGAVYLVYLGVRTITGWRDGGDGCDRGGQVAPPARSARRLYVDGLVVNVLNPKTALFFLAFMPQFVDPDRGPVWTQTLVLSLLFVVLGLLSDGTYALASAQVGRWLRRRPRAGRRGRFVEGGVLVGLGVSSLAVPHRRPP